MRRTEALIKESAFAAHQAGAVAVIMVNDSDIAEATVDRKARIKAEADSDPVELNTVDTEEDEEFDEEEMTDPSKPIV